MIPIIDLFAGPGGLAEGFGSLRDSLDDAVFDIRSSFEKDPVAHRTLSLRGFYRAFGHPGNVPDAYYDYLRGDISREDLLENPRFLSEARRAREEAHCQELGVTSSDVIDRTIRDALKGDERWVLIGGPPCQVYSVVGRSRRKREDVQKFESDPRHFLYKEYLRIIQKFRPAVFVMENVRGMLSSKHGGIPIFQRILDDLSNPSPGLHYQIRSLKYPKDVRISDPMDFVVQSESYGLPQARHRVMLLGVRGDIADRDHIPLAHQSEVSVRQAIGDLPQIRSMLSRGNDSTESWKEIFQELLTLLGTPKERGKHDFVQEMMRESQAGQIIPFGTGRRFMHDSGAPTDAMPTELAAWLRDKRLGGCSLHEARSHMRQDLYRYLYSACHAMRYGRSPKVDEFPDCLLPEHDNIYVDAVPFRDRFRVQMANQASTTVVSHICKDGHYYIHYDPAQCRSLTVREAARLQTFPDNYFFEGNRTEQYKQIGNAVPPFLARKVAKVVAGIVLNSDQFTETCAPAAQVKTSELSPEMP